MRGLLEVGLEVNLEHVVEDKNGPGEEESGDVLRSGELTKNYVKE